MIARRIGDLFVGMIAAVALIILAGAAPPGGSITYVSNQARKAAVITKSDSTVLDPPTNALFVADGAACNLAVKLIDDTAAVTLANVQIGQIIPVAAKSVMSTNTTCTSIIALY